MMASAVFQFLSLIEILSTVIGSPLTQYPKLQTLIRGANITFYCIFSEAPNSIRIKVYWWKRGESEYLQTKEDKRKMFGVERGRSEAYFHLRDVRIQDSGVYHCALSREGIIVGNGTGSHLTVCVSPTSPKISRRVVGDESATLALVCETAGFYPENLNLTWYKNGTEITTGINTTNKQSLDGLYEASSSMVETQAVQYGVVYTCQISHLSLQTPIIAKYTVVLPATDLIALFHYLKIAGYAGGAFAFLLLLILIAKRIHLRKKTDSQSVVDGSDHQGEQEAETEMVPYATLDLTSSQKTRRPKLQEERTVYAQTKQGAADNKMSYSTLDLSGSRRNVKPKRSNPNMESAQLQTMQASDGNTLTYVTPDLACLKKTKKAKCSKAAEYAEVQVGANRTAAEATFS